MQRDPVQRLNAEIVDLSAILSRKVKWMAVASYAWEFERLAKLSRQQPELVNRAVRRMLDEDADLRWALVVSAYLDHEINLGKAAALLGLHELELRERFIKLGIPLRIGPADVAEAQAEADALATSLTQIR
jgi:predicted HTH domain antitoxin